MFLSFSSPESSVAFSKHSWKMRLEKNKSKIAPYVIIHRRVSISSFSNSVRVQLVDSLNVCLFFHMWTTFLKGKWVKKCIVIFLLADEIEKNWKYKVIKTAVFFFFYAVSDFISYQFRFSHFLSSDLSDIWAHQNKIWFRLDIFYFTYWCDSQNSYLGLHMYLKCGLKLKELDKKI